MSSALFVPVYLIALAVFCWNVFPRRVEQDVADWEITPQQGRSYIFMYRGWSVGLALVGVVLAILTFAGQ